MIFPVEIWGRSSYQYYSPHQKICKVIDSLVIIIIHMGFFKLDVPVFRKHFVHKAYQSPVFKLFNNTKFADFLMHNKNLHVQIYKSLEI